MNLPSIQQITAEKVLEALNKKQTFFLLDVRTTEEYNKGKIEGSINLPVSEVQNKISTLIPDKNKVIFVYCLSGSRSDMATAVMTALGYTNVFSMTNGLLMWRSKKYPLVG